MSDFVFGIKELQATLDKVILEAQTTAKTIVKRAEVVVVAETQKQFTGAHKKGTPTTAAPGSPPDVVTGMLRRSVKMTPVIVSGIVASGSVYPSAVYARIQELGGDSTAPNWGSKKAKKATKKRAAVEAVSTGRHPIHIPARPFLEPAHEAARPKIQDIATEEWARILPR